MDNKSDLGIEENIDGVTIDELLENKTALKMLQHKIVIQEYLWDNKML